MTSFICTFARIPDLPRNGHGLAMTTNGSHSSFRGNVMLSGLPQALLIWFAVATITSLGLGALIYLGAESSPVLAKNYTSRGYATTERRQSR
jgi:hypothetical protein